MSKLFMRQVIEDRFPRNDSRITTSGQVIEQCGDSNTEEENDGESRSDLRPHPSDDKDTKQHNNNQGTDIPTEIRSTVSNRSSDAFPTAETIPSRPDLKQFGHIAIPILVKFINNLLRLLFSKYEISRSIRQEVYRRSKLVHLKKLSYRCQRPFLLQHLSIWLNPRSSA